MNLKPTGNRIIWTLFFLFVFVFLLRNSFSYLDPDLGWHLRVGQEILESKSVPSVEYYDYTLAGKKWVDHEWLTNAVIYFIYNHFGYIVLNIIFALLIITMLLTMNAFIKKYFVSSAAYFWLPFVLIPLETLGVVAISPHIGVRVQEIGILFLLLLLIIIKKFESTKNQTTLFWLIPLFYLWSCLHGSFLIGFCLLGLWAVIKFIENFTRRLPRLSFLKSPDLLAKKDLFIFSGFSLAAFAVTFFTPYGFKLYLFLLGYADNFYTKHISEWLPAFTYPFQYHQLLYLSFAGAILLIYFFNFYYSKKQQKNFPAQLDLWQISLFFIFLLLAFKSRRHFPLFFIVSLPIIAGLLAQELSQKKLRISFNNFFVKSYLAIAFVLVIAALFLKTNFTNEPFNNVKFCRYYPCAALDFLKTDRHYLDLKIFNSYNWGGYLIWAWPEKQLFIDGRLPQYPYKNHTFLEEYYEFFNKEKTEQKLSEYDIQLILLRVDQPTKVKWWEKKLFGIEESKINSNLNSLVEYFDAANEWENIYRDGISRVYKKIQK